MGRRCKCRICGKELNTDNAYRVQIISPSGKRNNSYYCNEGEYLNDKKEKEFYKKCQLEIDNILGYTCINNVKNKELTGLCGVGYTREQIYGCLIEYKESIIKGLDSKENMTEYQKLRYIFQVVKNNIKDMYTLPHNRIKDDTTEYDEAEMDVEISKEIKRVTKRKKKRTGLLDVLNDWL